MAEAAEPRSFAWMAANEKERLAVANLEKSIAEGSLDAGSAQGLSTFGDKFGGRDRCLLAYLRAGDVRLDTRRAVARLQSTLDFRRDASLDTLTDVPTQLSSHPLGKVWPMSFPFTAPDGCPVQYARAGAVKQAQLTKADGGEEGLRRYLVLWLARALELQAQVERTQHCRGTYDVYDCAGVTWDRCDVSSLRTLSRCITLGQQHFPENLYHCFVINAPRWASFVWTAIKPVLNERTKAKITISSGVPDALSKALGGDEAVQAMLNSVPTTLPVEESSPAAAPPRPPGTVPVAAPAPVAA